MAKRQSPQHFIERAESFERARTAVNKAAAEFEKEQGTSHAARVAAGMKLVVSDFTAKSATCLALAGVKGQKPWKEKSAKVSSKKKSVKKRSGTGSKKRATRKKSGGSRR